TNPRGTTVFLDVVLHPTPGMGANPKKGHLLLHRAALEYLRQPIPERTPARDPLTKLASEESGEPA
ncbi:MAG: hypothetical protein L3J96_05255, partial [Thermoplasmata archaeon]|nr:hypothetical protein [Thermoplasmata archaeon]